MQEARSAGDWAAYEAAETEMRRLLGSEMPSAVTVPKATKNVR